MGKSVMDEGAKIGRPTEEIEALISVDASVFLWRRRIAKSDPAAQLLTSLAFNIDLSEFEALAAVIRRNSGTRGSDNTGATVGDVATDLAIDPSHASRIVRSLVSKGYLRRHSSQSDARKSLLKPTSAGNRLFKKFAATRLQAILNAFDDWSSADLKAFEHLLSRYLSTMEALIDEFDG